MGLPAVPSLEGLGEINNGQYIEDVRGDEALYVEFYHNPVTDKDHIKIKIPGDERTVIDTIADERYKHRFARKWENYKGGGGQFDGQTRIETVAWIDPANVSIFKHNNIHTIEMLAGISDGAIGQTNMVGLMALRERAKKHLAETKKASAYDELKTENDNLRQRMESLEAMVQPRKPKK